MGNTLAQKRYESVLDARGAMLNTPTIPSNVGAILLSWEESLLLNKSSQLNLKDNLKEEILKHRHLFQ
jgi:hypothetical protein